MESRFESLERLAALRDRGVLTEAEFGAEKARLLRVQAAPGREAGLAPIASNPKLRWIGGGIAVALVLGGLLAYAARGDIQRGNSARDGRITEGGSRTAVSPRADNQPLDTMLVFASIQDCVPGGELGRIVKALGDLSSSAADVAPSIAMEDGGPSLPASIRRVQPRAEGAGAVIAEAPLAGVWRGLHVVAIRNVRWEGLPLSSFEIRFRESAPDAASALRRAGFGNLAAGKLRFAGNPVGTASAATIDSFPDGSALLCARGYPAPSADTLAEAPSGAEPATAVTAEARSP
jgi:hypothetical protein